jgi:hypothetical protein
MLSGLCKASRFFSGLTVLMVLCGAILVSCGGNSAINRTENYANAWPGVNYSTDRSIVVGVVDNRPYVLSGKVGPAYVGVMRGGYGNPFYMNTESGGPLSDDLGKALDSGLKNSGLRSKAIVLRAGTPVDEASKQLSAENSERALLLVVDEWKSDTYSTSRFLYDLTAMVYDDSGKLLATYKESNTDQKREEISAVSPLDAGRGALSKMLNAPSIEKALK